MKSVKNALFNSDNVLEDIDELWTKEDNMTYLDDVQYKQNKQKKTKDLKTSKRYNLAYVRFCKKNDSARDADGDETDVVKNLEKMWQEDFFKLKNAVDKKKRKSIAVKARYKEM
jgi:hypothetical protein